MTEEVFTEFLSHIIKSIDISLKISRAYLLDVLSKTDKENVVMGCTRSQKFSSI